MVVVVVVVRLGLLLSWGERDGGELGVESRLNGLSGVNRLVDGMYGLDGGMMMNCV